MTTFPHGLYESLVTEALAARLETLPGDRKDGQPAPINASLIPLLDSGLLTNSPDEPAVGHQSPRRSRRRSGST